MAADRVDRARDQAAAELRVLALAVVLSAAQARAADEWWAHDKAEHLIATSTISALGAELPRFWIASPWVRAGLGFGTAVVIGAGKELVDLAGFGDPSWKDFGWDVIGGVVGALVSIAFEWVFELVGLRSDAPPGLSATLPRSGGGVSNGPSPR